MAGDPPPKRVLLVEGLDDEHFVWHFCRRHEVTDNFCIINKGGFPWLRSAITTEMKVSGRRAVGILADADDNVSGRWREIVEELEKEGIRAEKRPGQTGTVIESRPRVGVWLMPDNRRRGELEDFVRELIPEEDPLWPLAEKYITDIPETDRKFQTHKALKAKVHAWLAAQKPPGRIGSAVTNEALTADGVPLASDFAKWLRDIFRK